MNFFNNKKKIYLMGYKLFAMSWVLRNYRKSILNYVYLYWEGCVIFNIYICANIWNAQYVLIRGSNK